MWSVKPERDSSIDPLLSHFQIIAPSLDPSVASYYPNITGFIHGDAVFHNITPPHTSGLSLKPPWIDAAEKLMADLNMTKLVESIGTWNWSASRKLALSVVEKTPVGQNFSQEIALVHVRLVILFPDVLCVLMR